MIIRTTSSQEFAVDEIRLLRDLSQIEVVCSGFLGYKLVVHSANNHVVRDTAEAVDDREVIIDHSSGQHATEIDLA